MEVIVARDYDEMSRVAANIIKDEIIKKPDMVLGLATGSTPKGMYRELIGYYNRGELDFSNIITFNLDEYVGLDKEHPSSYHHFMNDIFFDHINIGLENTHVPDGKAQNLEEYCKQYDRLIKEKGGIDLQVLGVGENGHIGFNEPDEELNMDTSIVELTESTIEVNSRFFESIDEVPKTAITMGMNGIMQARKIILMANGKRKAPIIRRIVNGMKLTTRLPVSLLMLHHDFTIIVDEEAYNG
ncbi:MAG: glucosamine-6-phosphate deaminase [Tissierellia bacterium]|nr:glucosamine-6-phosphate deaminase [Tissierellia bacterium]